MSVIAEVFEFVIGGMLLLAAIVFLILGLTPGETVTDDVLRYLQDSDQTLVIASIGIGLSYATGILGEGGSHAIFEWKLNRVTWSHAPFRQAATERIARRNRVAVAQGRDPEPELPSGYTAGRLHLLKEERERQRTYVMSRHPLIHREVESQLKRLRVERMAAVSGVIFVLAFVLVASGRLRPLRRRCRSIWCGW